MKKTFYDKSLIKLIFVLTLVLLFSNGSFSFGASPDAIGFRVIPNPNHLSPLRWYQENIKVKGSPQVLNVDGYEAVRDGRTVYVNAANIDSASNHCSKSITNKVCQNDSNCTLETEGVCVPNIYTNIYIISYNQQAENATLDIFGQILAHWKFNVNIAQEGRCSKPVDRPCLYSSECPSGEYCLSQKATVIRDTKRLADLADIKTVLDNYQKGHSGKYPALSAGSYLPGKSISKWPSWKGTLSKELGVTLPIDPINNLGKCRADCCATNNCATGNDDKSSCNYNQETCWDEKNKRFADPTADAEFNLPDDSRAYVYIASSTGASFTLCANMESVYVGTADGSCLGNTLANNPPVIITNSLLPGRSGAKYRGFVQARDPDGDILSWSINTAVTAAWTGWSAAPILKNTGVNNQIEIYADQAGANRSYGIAINVKDNRGGGVTKIFAINVITCTDGDEDGFFSEGGECGLADCVDTNGSGELIYPGAAETCDGADNNCDGVRDEGCQVIVTYCGDSDIQNPNDDGVNEQCDDGNTTTPNDGCNENCQTERIIITYCGDRLISSPNDMGIAETCDDGGTVNGDGCDRNYQIES